MHPNIYIDSVSGASAPKASLFFLCSAEGYVDVVFILKVGVSFACLFSLGVALAG
jgi:hypothetical protein